MMQEVFGLRHEGARISKWPLAAAPWAGQPSRLLAPDQIGAELLFFGTGVLPADCEVGPTRSCSARRSRWGSNYTYAMLRR